MTDNRKTTVPGASVGADAVQSLNKINTNIITNSGKQINLQAAKKSNNFGLNTVSIDEACQKASAGEFLYWQRTGACHAPVNAMTQEGGVEPGSGEVQRNLVRRRRPPAGRKGIF